MVIARDAFITELEKNDDFRRRHAERKRMKREKEEAARKFVEQYNRIIEEAAKETEAVIDKKLKEKGLQSGDIEELKFQVIYEMPSKYSALANQLDRRENGRTSSYVKVMKDVAALLIPRYVTQGWNLSYRHIKGGIFIFSIE
jgi:3-oxoacyl-[acyl-carrier-protein] synthase III